jgi:hypothetical protein
MKINIGPYPENSKSKRIQEIEIDDWDVWSMDCTLALIILPMLKKLKIKKQSAPRVENEDVPEELRESDNTGTDWLMHSVQEDAKYFQRWRWVLDEMIFAFESRIEDDEFSDNTRRSNGFRLFGKYYETLWT